MDLSALLRARLCCPGYRGWKLKRSSWRSPAGWSTRPNSTHSPNNVSSYSHSIIHPVCLCSEMLLLTCLFNLLTCFLSYSVYFSLSLCLLFLFYLSFFSLFSVCLYYFPWLTQSFLFFCLWLPISRCWDTLCEHDSSDQRPPLVILLGGGQEAFLHRQRQHGLEIPGHCIQNPPHHHTYSFTCIHTKKAAAVVETFGKSTSQSQFCTFCDGIAVK